MCDGKVSRVPGFPGFALNIDVRGICERHLDKMVNLATSTLPDAERTAVSLVWVKLTTLAGTSWNFGGAQPKVTDMTPIDLLMIATAMMDHSTDWQSDLQGLCAELVAFAFHSGTTMMVALGTSAEARRFRSEDGCSLPARFMIAFGATARAFASQDVETRRDTVKRLVDRESPLLREFASCADGLAEEDRRMGYPFAVMRTLLNWFDDGLKL